MKYFKLLPKTNLGKCSQILAIKVELARILRKCKKVENQIPKITITSNWHKEKLVFC